MYMLDSGKVASEYELLDFPPNAEIDLGKIKAEGVGLEPFQTTKAEKTEDSIHHLQAAPPVQKTFQVLEFLVPAL